MMNDFNPYVQEIRVLSAILAELESKLAAADRLAVACTDVENAYKAVVAMQLNFHPSSTPYRDAEDNLRQAKHRRKQALAAYTQTPQGAR